MNDYLNNIKHLFSSSKRYNINDFYAQNKFPEEAWKFVMQEIISALDLNNLDGLEIAKIFEGLGYASEDGGLNFATGAHMLAAVIPFSIYASEEQKENYLQPMLNGDKVCANAITETEAGSDIFSMTSNAVQHENKYILNGTKIFCSSINEAKMALVYVVTNKEKGAHGGITTFILDSSQFKIGQIFSKMGLRTCSIGEMIFDNTEVDASQILSKEGAGFGIFTTAMNWERIGLSAVYVGTMQRLFEMSVEYAKTRKQGGNTIGKYQAVSHKIAEMKTLINTSRITVHDAAKKLKHERTVNEHAAMCKLYVSETYVKVCQMAMQIHGGNGYMEDYGIERCLRDAHAGTIYSGTSEIQKNIIAKWNGL